MTVVCDTSPLLLLARADRLHLLRALYSTVVVPDEVLQEIRVQQDPPARDIQAYTEHPHVQRMEARDEMLKEVEETMGAGERRRLRSHAIWAPISSFWTMNGGAKKRDGMDSM